MVIQHGHRRFGRPDGRPWRDQKIAAPPISDIAHTVEQAVIRLPCRPDDTATPPHNLPHLGLKGGQDDRESQDDLKQFRTTPGTCRLRCSMVHGVTRTDDCLLTGIRQFDILHVIRAWRAHTIQVGRPLCQGDRLIALLLRNCNADAPQSTQLSGLSSLAGAASLLDRGDSLAQERPPEITTVRIPTGSLICNAPTYIADELLRAEGFTDIQHVPVTPESSAGPSELMERGELDFGMVYTPPMVVAIEAGSRSTVLAGVHIGCNSLFAHEGIRSVRDLKGKKVALPDWCLAAADRPAWPPMSGSIPPRTSSGCLSPSATAKELFVRAQDRRLPRPSARPAGTARAENRPCDRQ